MHADALIDDWVAYALALNEGRSKLSQADLRNSAPGILAALAANMGQSQSKKQAVEKSHGVKRQSDQSFDQVCQAHARDRLAQGFSLNDIIAEFRALRASVVRRWRAHPDFTAHDIDDLQRFHEAIDQALTESVKEYSARAERARALFAGVLAHDLRAPLGVVLHAATLLSRSGDARASPECAKHFDFIQRSTATMKLLIDDLLVFARTRLGDDPVIAASPQDMGIICKEIADHVGSVFDDKAIEVKCVGDLHGVWDRGRIEQLLTNLLSNAVRYGDGVVKLSAIGGETEVEVRVENGGKPIPERALPTLFDPLTTLNAVSGSPDMAAGVGLGLYICRSIAVAHQGSIAVDSNESRTVFTLLLPKDRQAKPR